MRASSVLLGIVLLSAVLAASVNDNSVLRRLNDHPGWDGPDGGGGSGGGGGGGGSGWSEGEWGGSHSGYWFDWWGTDGGAYYPQQGGGYGAGGNYGCYYNYTLLNTTAICQGALDVVFLIDSSSSISDSDYAKALNFVKNVLKYFYLHPNYTQVSILEFSTEVRELKELTYDACELRKALNVSRLSGMTNIAAAIEAAHQKLKSSRPDIPDQIVLITDGYQTVYPKNAINCKNYPHECNMYAIEKANAAKADDIQIYVIGVGAASYYEDDLRQMASQPSDEYFSLAEDYSHLNQVLEKLGNSTCPTVTRVLPDCACNEEMPQEILMVGHGFPRSDAISLSCQFGDFPATKAKVINQTHLQCDGPKLVDRKEWDWQHTGNFVWGGASDVPISLYYNGKSIIQEGASFTYKSCPSYWYLLWVFLGIAIVAALLAVLAYIASHTKLEKKQLPVHQKAAKPAAPPKPEHGGQIDLSMMEV